MQVSYVNVNSRQIAHSSITRPNEPGVPKKTRQSNNFIFVDHNTYSVVRFYSIIKKS